MKCLLFEHLAGREIIEVNFFLNLFNELYVFFWKYQFHLIPISYEEDIKIYSKQAFVEFF
jgi:hypothetical protein